MTSWPVQDAKANFDRILEASLADGPQILTRRGDAVAVLVKATEWQQLRAMAKPSLKDLLFSADARTESLVPARDAAHPRRAARFLQTPLA
ncbi:type II toxin-antitoxin system [compost metagenome]